MNKPPHAAMERCLTVLPRARQLVIHAACVAAAVSLGAETADNWRQLPKSNANRAEASGTKGAKALADAPASQSREPRRPTPSPQPVVMTYNTADEAETPATTASENTKTAPTPSPITAQVGGKTLYSFKAENLELKAALAIFARANKLNIVPDQEVTGQVTLDLEDLPLDRVMQALLEAHDYSWIEQDGLIRVRAKETREFQVDYLRLSRKGSGMSSAMLASGMSGGSGGSGGGGGAASGGSSVNLTGENNIAFWTELKAEMERLLTPAGRENIAINQTAGLLQITDRPSALKRVERYIDNLSLSISRQVEIQARIFDVTLKDQFQFGIDWQHAAQAFGGVATIGASPSVATAAGGQDIKKEAFKFLFKDENTQVLLTALKEQGEVNVVSQPRIRVLNNQTAMIKVGTETPFFTRRSIFIPGQTTGTTSQTQEDDVTTITVGTILAITPQISSNEWVTLDIAPVLSSLVETKISPSELTTAPVLDIKQASTLVRVRAGTTVVIGGLMQDERAKTVRSVPLLGDIPLLGKLFQGRFDVKAKKELVISITPNLVQ